MEKGRAYENDLLRLELDYKLLQNIRLYFSFHHANKPNEVNLLNACVKVLVVGLLFLMDTKNTKSGVAEVKSA